jgi:hypothetical protein
MWKKALGSVVKWPGYPGGNGGISMANSIKWPIVQGNMPTFPGFQVTVPSTISSNAARNLLDLRSFSAAKKTGLDVFGRYSIAQMLDMLFFANGKDAVQIYDPANGTVRDLGLAAPAAVPGTADQGSGSFAGTYTYAVRWKRNATGEFSALSDIATHSASGSGESIRVSWTDPSIAGADKCEVFRSKTATVGPLYLIATVDITTELYDDSTADSAIDITLIAPARPAPGASSTVPTFDFIESYNGRLWGVADEKLYWSEANFPWLFPSSNFVLIQPNDRDTVTAIRESAGVLYIFKKRHTYVVSNIELESGIAGQGQLLLPTITMVDSATGAASEDAIVTAENRLYFMSGEGKLYELAGGAAQEIGPKLEGTLKTLFTKRLSDVSAGYDEMNRKVWFSVTVDEDVHNNKCIVLDLAAMGWYLDSRHIETLGQLRDADGRERMVFGDVLGNIYQMGYGSSYGALTGTLYGTVTSATKNTLTDSAATFATDCAGLPIVLIDSDNTIVQRSVIGVRTSATALELLYPWTTIPDTNYSYCIGACFPEWKYGYTDFDSPSAWKALKMVEFAFTPSAGKVAVYLSADEGAEIFIGYFDLANTRGKWSVPVFYGGNELQVRIQALDGGQSMGIHAIEMDVRVSGYNFL